MPSFWSSLANSAAKASCSSISARSRGRSSPTRRARLAPATARGARLAIRSARARARGSSSAGLGHLVAQAPGPRLLRADGVAGVDQLAGAADADPAQPAAGCRRSRAPRPRSPPAAPAWRSTAARMKSQASASSSPPPRAKPLTAAITGTASASIRSPSRRPSSENRRAWSTHSRLHRRQVRPGHEGLLARPREDHAADRAAGRHLGVEGGEAGRQLLQRARVERVEHAWAG